MLDLETLKTAPVPFTTKFQALMAFGNGIANVRDF